MNNKKITNLPMITFITGLLLMLLSLVLLHDSLANLLDPLRISAAIVIYLCPIIGLIGLVTAILKKQILLAIGNLAIIFAFPIMMIVVQLINLL